MEFLLTAKAAEKLHGLTPSPFFLVSFANDEIV
jgi:hypothetical protein